MTIHSQIKELLSAGHTVISHAAGRFGEVVRVGDGTTVNIRLQRSKVEGVTTFDSGDKVHLVERDGVWYVENTFEEIGEAV